MAIELIPLDPLERGYLSVLRIRSAMGWLTLSAIAILKRRYVFL